MNGRRQYRRLHTGFTLNRGPIRPLILTQPHTQQDEDSGYGSIRWQPKPSDSSPPLFFFLVDFR